jgi:hypothetical protein
MPIWQRMGLGVLADYIPAGLVDQVLADTGQMQQRIRRLPARAVVWFILALTLFSGQGYRSVWREPSPGSAAATSSWSTYADTATMPRLFVGGRFRREDVRISCPARAAGIGIVPAESSLGVGAPRSRDGGECDVRNAQEARSVGPARGELPILAGA